MTNDVAAAFDSTPPAYGTGGDFHARYAEALVSHARLRLDESVLDVATGTAPAAIAASQVVGAGALVTGIDTSDGMLDQARRNVAAAGEMDIALIHADGARMPFEDGTFDVVLCSWPQFVSQDPAIET